MAARLAFWLVALAAFLHAAEEFTWWIEPCTPAAAKSTSCQTGDAELGRWALEAWQRESRGGLIFRSSATEEHARIRIHWAGGANSLYGETQPAIVDGQRGANIYVLPDVRALGDDISQQSRNDPLFRDAIVYLTCLHESGHALGPSTHETSPISCTASSTVETSSLTSSATAASYKTAQPSPRTRVFRKLTAQT